jgi:hypothetical protein
MANPKNNFGNFFNDPRPAMEKFRPPPGKVAEALMVLISGEREWYTDQNKRLIVLGTLNQVAEDMKKFHATNPTREEMTEYLSPAATAFLMVIGDLIRATQQHASPFEIETYHTDVDEDDYEDEDSED